MDLLNKNHRHTGALLETVFTTEEEYTIIEYFDRSGKLTERVKFRGKKNLDSTIQFSVEKIGKRKSVIHFNIPFALVETFLSHQEIINGKDEIENPLPVFTVAGGKLVESVTDKYGWPNTDDDGICMYQNTHFPTKEQAIEYGIQEYKAGETLTLGNIKELEEELSKAKQRLEKYRSYIAHLESLKGN